MSNSGRLSGKGNFSFDENDSMDTYLLEWQSIRKTHVGLDVSGEVDEEREDQGIYTNPDAIWLEKLGFGSYVSQLETGDQNEETEDTFLKNAGLSRHHTYAIRRRMDTLRTTMKIRRGRWNREARMGGGVPGGGSNGIASDPKLYSRKMNTMPASLSQSTSSRHPSCSIPSSEQSRSEQPQQQHQPFQHSHRGEQSGEYSVDSGIYSTCSSRDVQQHQQIPSPASGDQAGIWRGSTTSDPRVPVVKPKLASNPKQCSGLNTPQQLQEISLKGPTVRQFQQEDSGNSKKNQVAQPIGEEFGVEGVKDEVNGMKRKSSYLDRSPSPIPRSMSEKPVSSPAKNKGRQSANLKRMARTTARNKMHRNRSVSPLSPSNATELESSVALSPLSLSSGCRGGSDSCYVSSPDDIKLDFETSSVCADISNGHDPNSMQELPNFMISPDALGITRIQDLSLVDMEKVRSVALLELTVTFDDHDIPLRSRRPARVKSYPENMLHAVPLTLLLQADQKRHPAATIPLIYNEMISYLETRALDTEGILRVPGSTSRINSLLQELEASFHYGQFSFSGVRETDVCSLLKQFIRNLPVPILTREYLPAFASIADISDLKEQVRTLNLLVLLLPDVHQKLLKRLLEFFSKIAEHSATNKMDLKNVAMVIAPNLFINLPVKNTLDDVTVAAKTSHVVRLLIKYHHLLWTIPGEMLRQIRYLYENEVRRLNQRSIQKAIKQMQHQLMDQPSKGIIIPEISHHIIRIKTPLFTRVCMAVDISVGVTAGDIITKLKKKSRFNKELLEKICCGAENSRTNLPNDPTGTNSTKLPEDVPYAGKQFLFEVGGNIGERCLPDNTDMYALYAVNPNAQWIIKPFNCPGLN